MNLLPLHFVNEAITVEFDPPPALEKRPGCPQAFIWRGQRYAILETLAEWHDYRRRGAMQFNMRSEHAASAARRGSWGVGRDHYRVAAAGGRIFEIVYDRAPGNVDHRKGGWYLFQELSADSASGPGQPENPPA
jgi:hypothetical protein